MLTQLNAWALIWQNIPTEKIDQVKAIAERDVELPDEQRDDFVTVSADVIEKLRATWKQLAASPSADDAQLQGVNMSRDELSRHCPS